ncbi:hypothetical protein NL386_24120 [Klebsiella pneumoniae]|nr:hypothetical protein [Klebsiella pneumoniae]
MTEEQKRIERAIELACRYGGTDEMHHLQWVVDREHKKYWGSVSYAAIAGPFPSL